MSREHQVRLPDRFWRFCTALSPEAKCLYSILLTFIDYQTCTTFVGNSRLERESGFGSRKVKTVLQELEQKGYIRRVRELRANLKWKRHIKCLKFVSTVRIPHDRPDGAVFDPIENAPISLPSHASVPGQSHTSNASSLTVGAKPQKQTIG